MTAAHALPVLVTVDDAAASLALHPDHVRRLLRRGELVGYSLGRAVRVDLDSVRAYLSRCRLHVPQLVPAVSSEAPTSTAAGTSGTRAAGRRSRKTASPSAPPTAPKPSDDSQPDWSAMTPDEMAAKLRAIARRR